MGPALTMGILNVVMRWLVLGVLIFLIVNDREDMGLDECVNPTIVG